MIAWQKKTIGREKNLQTMEYRVSLQKQINKN